ncbi:MAG: hypothetical protein LBQ10_03900 [Desulfovibrio sp.]|nr:hypothetical protein [Desulfovibrio sp.]
MRNKKCSYFTKLSFLFSQDEKTTKHILKKKATYRFLSGFSWELGGPVWTGAPRKPVAGGKTGKIPRVIFSLRNWTLNQERSVLLFFEGVNMLHWQYDCLPSFLPLSWRNNPDQPEKGGRQPNGSG